MHGVGTLRLIPLVLLAWLELAGCRGGFRGGSDGIRIPHPGRVELVSQGTIIQHRDERAERRRGMGPGTLVDSVALTRVDPNGICVQMALWAAHDDLHRGDYTRYTFELQTVDAPETPARTVYAAQVTPVGQWDQNHLGRHTRQVPNGLRDECVDHDMDGWCEAYQTRVTTRSVREQANVGIRYYAADICFPGQGVLADGTRSVALIMRYRRRTQRYVWDLDPAAQYPRSAPSTLVVGPGGPGMPPSLAPGRLPVGPPTAGGQVSVAPAPGGNLSTLPLPYPIEQALGGHPVDDAQLRRLLHARWGALRLCLGQVAEQAPSSFMRNGYTIAQFTVGPSGVANVQVTQNDFPPAAAACVEQHLSQLPVPADPMRWTAMYRYGVENQVVAAGAI